MDSHPSPLIIAEIDTRPLDACPLSWRWTDSRFAVFSVSELSELHCLTQEKARAIDAYLRPTVAAWQAHTASAAGAHTISTVGDAQAVGAWLAQQWPDLQTAVVVSWDSATAVAVPWGLFVQRWDDFCYPSSDDVAVAAATGQWVVEYAHYEQFRWLARPSTPRHN
jgi:hypothetical protein